MLCVASPGTACATSCEAFWLPVPHSFETQNCAYTEDVGSSIGVWWCIIGLQVLGEGGQLCSLNKIILQLL